MEIDCKFTDEIVCPYCGNKYQNSYELLRETITSGKEKCEECEKEFKWEANFETTYITEKIEI